jgi:hypothetical protein
MLCFVPGKRQNAIDERLGIAADVQGKGGAFNVSDWSVLSVSIQQLMCCDNTFVCTNL